MTARYASPCEVANAAYNLRRPRTMRGRLSGMMMGCHKRCQRGNGRRKTLNPLTLKLPGSSRTVGLLESKWVFGFDCGFVPRA